MENSTLQIYRIPQCDFCNRKDTCQSSLEARQSCTTMAEKLLPAEVEPVNQPAITDDQLRVIQETADAQNLLLPTELNRSFDREYAADSQDNILLPTST